uniref:Leucine-rich repeats and calponin homology (CH) domain containing 4 n=1 Tax=Hucho hucho TaxID=62062 RepID=A0A4W5LW24_9TELE
MAAGDGAQLPATIAASRSVEKSLEEAAASGALNLSNRKLKEFSRTARNHDLSDIVHADLSKNRLCELPEELCQFISLETLSLYHNCIRSLTPSLCHLQALTYLNLSRNLISNLPPSVCQLPLLRVLIISNNKLLALPASIHTLTHLRQLDVSCNDLQCLPVELGQLECLRDLNLRRNRLTTLPKELSELPLVRLDVSSNCISHVPVCYRHLRHLQTIVLDNNPLQQPPAQVCSKGKYHIFKFLNIEACKRSQEELERALRPTRFNSW